MADHAEDDDEAIFIYRGGRAPQHFRNFLIDESVNEIEDRAFEYCGNLLQVDTHDGIRKIGKAAFYNCTSLLRINLKSARKICANAFSGCRNLEYAEFGDRLETIENFAFYECKSLNNHLKFPSVITIGVCAFADCTRLTDIELSERLETIGSGAFMTCERLQRIAIPLKRNLLQFSEVCDKYNQFDFCEELATVDLVWGIHKTVASLHMESWRTEMIADINRINQVLPNTRRADKTDTIRRWMETVLDKMDHYKAEHIRYVKEGTTLLELALWKAKLGEKEGDFVEGRTKKAKVDAGAESYRRDKRITCGADMVIKNVLPFLQLDEC